MMLLGLNTLFEDDAPQLGGRKRSQAPMNLATQMFDMTQDRSAPMAIEHPHHQFRPCLDYPHHHHHSNHLR